MLFSGIPNLENLELDSTGITDEGVRLLALSCSQIRRQMRYLLVGSHEPTNIASITDEGMKWIGHMHTLEALDLAHQARITTKGLLTALAGLPRLRYLNLDGTNVNDETTAAIAKYAKNLEWLSLQNTKITDTTMRTLSSLPKLRSLGVTYCEKLTPACVPLLINMPALETVELLDCTRTTVQWILRDSDSDTSVMRQVGETKAERMMDVSGLEKMVVEDSKERTRGGRERP
eukprot:jgi/Bigna1/140616/aug1.57_g15324